MPKYLLLLRGDVTLDYSSFTPDDMQKVLEAYESWAGKMAAQGLLHDGKKLTDQGGCVMIPNRKGGVTLKDGPYAETKEVVGGFYLITAKSYEHAVELCR